MVAHPDDELYVARTVANSVGVDRGRGWVTGGVDGDAEGHEEHENT